MPGCNGAGTVERSYTTFEVRGSGQDELLHVRGQGQQLRGATPRPRSGAATKKSDPMSKARDGSREEQPHVQGAVAVWAQKGLEEIFHDQGQKGRR